MLDMLTHKQSRVKVSGLIVLLRVKDLFWEWVRPFVIEKRILTN